MKEFFCSLQPDTIIALLAFIVSFFGLILSIYFSRRTLNITFRYNKLSLKPLIGFHYDGIENYESIKIANWGPGPAIVKKIAFVYNGKSYQNTFEIYKCQNTKEFERITFKKPPNRFLNIYEQLIIGPNNEVEFSFIELNCPLKESEFQEIREKIKLYIVYENIFEENEKPIDVLLVQ